MSRSSGASSAPGFRRAAGRRRGSESRSPVVYRENPMAYEPPKLCHCNPPRKAPRWIPWSMQNPGRRYYACVDAMNGAGCGYVEWHDPPLPKFWNELVGDLRDEVWRLREGGNEVHNRAPDAGRDSEIEALQALLKEKDEKLLNMKGKYENLVFLCIVFVVGLVAGKMLMY